MKRLIGAREFAEKLGVSPRMLEELIARGQVPQYIRFGRLRRWDEVQVDSWLDKQFQQPTCPAQQREEYFDVDGKTK